MNLQPKNKIDLTKILELSLADEVKENPNFKNKILAAGIGKDKIKLYGSLIEQVKEHGDLYVLRAASWRKDPIKGYLYDVDSIEIYQLTKTHANTIFQVILEKNSHYEIIINDLIPLMTKEIEESSVTNLSPKPKTNQDSAFKSDKERPIGKDFRITRREFASIMLRVPDSGTAWLDEMIKKSHEIY